MRTLKAVFNVAVWLAGSWLAASAPAYAHPQASHQDDQVEIQTELGNIIVQVDSAAAPGTARNFLRHVDAHAYDGGSFFRTVRMDNQPNDIVRIEVIQGETGPSYKAVGAIPLEPTSQTGLKHVAGTISMARGAPDTAWTSFFICVTDQPELDFGGSRNPDRQGFAAFGKVVQGMDIVRNIHQAQADGQALNPVVAIHSISRVKFSQ